MITEASRGRSIVLLLIALIGGCTTATTNPAPGVIGRGDGDVQQTGDGDDNDGDGIGDGDGDGDGDSLIDGDGDGDSSRDGDAGEVGKDAGSPGDSGTHLPGKRLPPVASLDEMGPFAVTIEMSTGPNGGFIARPTDLGKDGLLHPLFTWGCGAGSQPSQYRDHLTRWASHGFVIEAHASTGDGTDHVKAIDWLIAENAKPSSKLYQKLDITKIASGGHSQGSVSTFAMADDTRLTTTIHVAGGSFDGKGPTKLKRPTAYICGANDASATGNAQRDYEGTTVPVFFAIMDGVNHIYAAREGMGAVLGWLRWHLAGELDRKAMFIGANCQFCTGKFKSMSKNW